MKSNIIFLQGLSGSGKDTVGEVFIKNGYTRIAFADIAKIEFAKVAGIDLALLHDRDTKEQYRPALINFAEERKKTQPTYWVDKAFEPYRDSKGKWKDNLKLIVTDFRRTEEVEWLYKLLWEETNAKISVIYIERPDIQDPDGIYNQRAIAMTLGIDLVCSTALGWNFINEVIVNDKDIESLNLEAERVLKFIEHPVEKLVKSKNL